MPKVSICVPVYNVEQYIGRCIESIQNQTLSDIEILVVNDATPDKSMHIVEKYASHDSRIRIINNPKNRGLMATRQVGYTNAIGNYITFLDSDDWLPDNAIENLYNKALETNADIICGTLERTDGNGSFYGKFQCNMPYGSDKIGAFKALLCRDLPQNICSKLFKRELLQNFRYVAEEHCVQAEDAGALFQFVNNAKKIVAINDVVYYYYYNPASSTHNLTRNSLECICKMTIIRDKILQQYKELDELRYTYFVSYLHKFHIRTDGMKIIKLYGLQKYTSFKVINKYLNRKNKILFYIRLILWKLKIRNI